MCWYGSGSGCRPVRTHMWSRHAGPQTDGRTSFAGKLLMVAMKSADNTMAAVIMAV